MILLSVGLFPTMIRPPHRDSQGSQSISTLTECNETVVRILTKEMFESSLMLTHQRVDTDTSALRSSSRATSNHSIEYYEQRRVANAIHSTPGNCSLPHNISHRRTQFPGIPVREEWNRGDKLLVILVSFLSCHCLLSSFFR